MVEQWNAFLEVLNVFKVPYVVTNALQTPTITLSNFNFFWLKIEHKLVSQSTKQHLLTDFGVLLLEKLRLRKKSLLKNAAMMSAVFLDPRVRLDLNEDEIFIAKNALEKLYRKVKSMKAKNTSNDGNSTLNS